MLKMPDRMVLSLIAMLVCFPSTVIGQQPPAQDTAASNRTKIANPAKKDDRKGRAASGRDAKSQLEITQIDPAVMTASDSLQALTLKVAGAKDDEKLKITLKSPDSKNDSEQESKPATVW